MIFAELFDKVYVQVIARHKDWTFGIDPYWRDRAEDHFNAGHEMASEAVLRLYSYVLPPEKRKN